MDSLPLTWEGAGLGLTYPSCQAKGHTWGGVPRPPASGSRGSQRSAQPGRSEPGPQAVGIEGEPRGLSVHAHMCEHVCEGLWVWGCDLAVVKGLRGPVRNAWSLPGPGL